jgi:hypothetical protein
MNYTEFSEKKEELYAKIFTPSESMMRKYSKIYAFTRANIRNLLPDFEMSKYEQFFKQTFFNQQISALEQDVSEIIDSTLLSGDHEFLLKDSGSRIFCTFHLGSYRLINSILTKFNKNYAILTDSRVIQEQSSSFLNSWKLVSDVYGTSSKFEIFDAERRDVLLKITRFLKENNRYLVVYLDGNTGVGGQLSPSDNSNLVEIPFLKAKIKSRKGIVFIANHLKIPIVPVLNYRSGNKITLHFFDAIENSESLEKEDFCLRTLSALYNNFTDHLVLFPNQWEGWFYIHYSIVLSSVVPSYTPSHNSAHNGYLFNSDQFTPFTYSNNSKYILDRFTYKSHQVNEETFNFIESIQSGNKNFGGLSKSISSETINNLLNYRIIH